MIPADSGGQANGPRLPGHQRAHQRGIGMPELFKILHVPLLEILAQSVQAGITPFFYFFLIPVNDLDRGRVKYGFKTRSEEHTSELQSLMRISYAVFVLKKKK